MDNIYYHRIVLKFTNLLSKMNLDGSFIASAFIGTLFYLLLILHTLWALFLQTQAITAVFIQSFINCW